MEHLAIIDYPANCLQPNCLLGGNLTGGNWSLCTHSQNASTIYLFYLFVFSQMFYEVNRDRDQIVLILPKRLI